MYRFLCNLLNSPLKFAFNQPVIERHTNWTTKYPAWAVLVPTWSNPTPIEVFYGRAALTNKLAAALMVCFDVFIDEHCLCNLVTTKTNLWNQWNFDSHHSCQIPFFVFATTCMYELSYNAPRWMVCVCAPGTHEVYQCCGWCYWYEETRW